MTPKCKRVTIGSKAERARRQKGEIRMRIRKGLSVLAALAVMSGAFGSHAQAEETLSAYVYTSGTVRLCVGDDWNSAYRALGRETECRTLSNSTGSGRIKYYAYRDCDIYVSRNAKEETVIDTIVLKSPAQTEEGVTFGQTPDSVKKAYPDAKSEYGLYTSELGDTRIVIDCGVRDDKVVSISYERKD